MLRMGNMWTPWAEIAMPGRMLTSLATRFTLEPGWRPAPRMMDPCQIQLFESRVTELVAQPDDQEDWECNADEQVLPVPQILDIPRTMHTQSTHLGEQLRIGVDLWRRADG